MTRIFYKEYSILEILIEKVKNSFPKSKIIVATTNHASDNALASMLSKLPVQIYRGDVDNVLSRFISIGDKFEVEHFVRICGDNLFLDMGLLREMIDNYSSGFDYMTYMINGKPSMKTTFGFFAEISKISVLKSVIRNTNESQYLEHVTNYVYSNPNKYKVKFLIANQIFGKYADIRFTIDTITDFENAKMAYGELIKANPSFNYLDVINWAVQNNRLPIMATENLKNIK